VKLLRGTSAKTFGGFASLSLPVHERVSLQEGRSENLAFRFAGHQPEKASFLLTVYCQLGYITEIPTSFLFDGNTCHPNSWATKESPEWKETMSVDLDSPQPPTINVWDSQYAPSREAFSIFRETICNTFMPWTPEIVGTNFEGRVESIQLENGIIGRVRMSSIIASKTKSNIANSAQECIHGNFILAGELKVEQGGRTTFAQPGDLVLYHSFSPVILTVKPDSHFDNLAFIIPTSRFATIPNAEDNFCNTLLAKSKMIDPLASCLAFIVRKFHSSSADELGALFNACVALLPLSAGCFGNAPGPDLPKLGHVLREILHFINENISDPNLSPQLAAETCGISIRYVHKLFARLGTTFSSYVAAQRLEHIRSELIAYSTRSVPISMLAYQWGFSDLSTFNRAFKDRFGRTPSHFRKCSDPSPFIANLESCS
jgi:AraC-like DNA-binding protein